MATSIRKNKLQISYTDHNPILGKFICQTTETARELRASYFNVENIL